MLALLRGGDLDGQTNLSSADREAQLDKLTAAIDVVLDLTSWHEFLKTLMSAGFRRSNEISSQNNVVLVYALYLIGREYGLSHSALRTTIARYFFMSSLTGRYTGSFETQITQDVQSFTEADDGAGYLDRLRHAISTTLTEDYWTITLPQALATSAATGPGLFGYAAALCLVNARVPPFVDAEPGDEQKAALFLRDLFDPVLQPKKAPIDRHHLFPRKYLENQGISGTRSVNQIANLSYVEWPENIEISAAAPSTYWPRYADRFSPTDCFHHALPDGWADMGYDDFLEARRKLIAQVIRKGFETIGAGAATGPASVGVPSLVPTGIADSYLHPDTPFSNDLAIRRIVRQLRGNVLWYEQHMDRKALEILTEELSVDQVDQVRLLSGPANLSSKTKKAFERFVAELESKGVVAEWRVLPAEQARSLHARVISDDAQTFEVPPLNSVLAGAVDSIRASEIPMDAFEDAWADGAAPLSEYQTQA